MESENRCTNNQQNASEASLPLPQPKNLLSNQWDPTSNPYQYYSHHPWCPMVYYHHNQYYPSNANIEQKPINLVNSYDSYYKMMPSMPTMSSIPSMAMPSMLPYYGQPMYDTMSNANMQSMYSMSSSAQPNTPSMATKRVQPKPVASKAVSSNGSVERKSEKQYSCKLCAGLDCNVETNDEKMMRIHADIHLGSGPPFVCAVCTKQFPFRSTLRNHFVAHMVVRCVN